MRYIFLGVICEIYWVYGLKHFINSFWGMLSIALAVIVSFGSLIFACKKIEVSIAYAIYVGLGTAGIVVVDMIHLGLEWKKLVLICCLLFGIVGLKLCEGKAQ